MYVKTAAILTMTTKPKKYVTLFGERQKNKNLNRSSEKGIKIINENEIIVNCFLNLYII